MTKSCVICGEEFEAKGKDVTCSKPCSSNHKKNKRRGYYLKYKIELDFKECRMCGISFKPFGSSVTCSSKCSKKLELSYAQKYTKLWRAKNPERHRENRRKTDKMRRKLGLKKQSPEKRRLHEQRKRRRKQRTKTLLMLMALPSAIKETANQTNP
jgi:predicted nucleic acid-binding Zn ribbon protein